VGKFDGLGPSFFRASILRRGWVLESESYYERGPAVETAEIYWQEYAGTGDEVAVVVEEFPRSGGPGRLVWVRRVWAKGGRR
jgi:hypothetical protein